MPTRRILRPIPSCAPGGESATGAARPAARRRGWRAASRRASSSLNVAAAIDVAVAGAVLQRDAPLPARRARRRARVRRRAARRVSHGTAMRAVARQPVRPVLVAGLQRLLDQQAAKAGAIDEQVAVDPLRRLRAPPRRRSRRPARSDVDDLAFDALHAARLGVAAQVPRVQAGVEVVGVGDVAPAASAGTSRGRAELAARRRRRVQRIRRRGRRPSPALQLAASTGGTAASLVAADRAEAVDVAVAEPRPSRRTRCRA